jgi:hypothetical protein
MLDQDEECRDDPHRHQIIQGGRNALSKGNVASYLNLEEIESKYADYPLVRDMIINEKTRYAVYRWKFS